MTHTRLPAPHGRQRETQPARRAPIRPGTLKPVLVQIANEFPDLAEAILDVVSKPANPREAGRWY